MASNPESFQVFGGPASRLGLRQSRRPWVRILAQAAVRRHPTFLRRSQRRTLRGLKGGLERSIGGSSEERHHTPSLRPATSAAATARTSTTMSRCVGGSLATAAFATPGHRLRRRRGRVPVVDDEGPDRRLLPVVPLAVVARDLGGQLEHGVARALLGLPVALAHSAGPSIASSLASASGRPPSGGRRCACPGG